MAFLDIAKLQVVFEGDASDFNRTTRQVQSDLHSTGNAAQGMGGIVSNALGVFTGSLMVAASQAVTNFASDAVKGFSDLEQSVANLSSIVPNIDTSQVFNALNEMQVRVPQSARELGDALYEVHGSFEATQKEGLKLVEQMAKGAVGATTPVKNFTTAILGSLNAYKLDASEATRMMDLFFNTVKQGSNLSGQQLASGLGPILQAAKALGQTPEMAFAVSAAVTKEGGTAEPNLNRAVNLLSKLSTKEVKKELIALGVQVEDTSGKFRPLTGIFTDLGERIKGLSQAAKTDALNKIFPDAEARQGAQVLLSQLGFLKQSLTENETQSGSAESAYKKMSATFASQSQLLKNGLSAIGTAAASEVLPMLTPLVSVLAKQLPDAISGTRESIAAFKAEAVPALESVLTYFTGVPVKFSEIGAQIGQFVTGAVAVFKEHWPQIRQVAEAVLTPLVQFVAGNVRIIVGWFRDNMPLIQQTVGTVLRTIAEFWREHGAQIMAVIKPLWTLITTVVTTALKVIGGIVKASLQVINGDWKGALNTLWEAAKTLFSGLVKAFEAGLHAFASAFNALDKILNDVGKRVVEAAKGLGAAIVQGLVNGINAGVKFVNDAGSSMADSLVTAVANRLVMHSPSRVFMGLGANVAAGFALGILSGTPDVSAAGTTLAAKAHQSAKDALSRQQGAYSKEVAKLRAELTNINATGQASDVAAKYNLLSAAQRSYVQGLREQIAGVKDAVSQNASLRSQLNSVNAALRDIRAGGGNGGQSGLAAQFPLGSSALVAAVANAKATLQGKADADQLLHGQMNTLKRAIAETNAKYMELTATQQKATAVTVAERLALDVLHVAYKSLSPELRGLVDALAKATVKNDNFEAGLKASEKAAKGLAAGLASVARSAANAANAGVSGVLNPPNRRGEGLPSPEGSLNGLFGSLGNMTSGIAASVAGITSQVQRMERERVQSEQTINRLAEGAKQAAQAGVADAFAGRGGDAVRKFAEGMRQTVQSMIGDFIGNQIASGVKALIRPLFDEMNELLRSAISGHKESLSALASSIGSLLAQVYAAMAASGARGKKQQTGALLGAFGALVAAPFTGGASLALLPAAMNAGAFLADPGIDTGLAVAASAGSGGFNMSKAGGRAVNVTNNFYGNVNNAADLQRLEGGVTRAVESGLRVTPG